MAGNTETTTAESLAETVLATTVAAETLPSITTAEPTATPSPSPTAEPTPVPTPKPTAKPTPKPTAVPIPASGELLIPYVAKSVDPTRLAGHVVVLDPGHQRHPNYDLELIAPWTTETKIKTSSGTSGIVAEYIYNLDFSLKLQAYLEAQGCVVFMTRTTHDVDLSNIDRALFAVANNPDAYLRVHCNGGKPAANGVGIYVNDTGAYAADVKVWGQWLADELCESTGAKNNGVHPGSSYTGLNWANSIPSYLVEMGYMTNAAEDKRLNNPDYQMELCEGYADFIERIPMLTVK